MKVRCTSNRGTGLPDLYLDPVGGYRATNIFPLEIEKEYVVYALTIRRGGVWYYILSESGVAYPVWHPAPLFEVSDPRPSRYWLFGFADSGLRDGSALFAIPEWARAPGEFYDRLTDGHHETVACFARYRAMMEQEHDDVDSKAVAEDVGDGWLLCPSCHEAWQTFVRGTTVRCPNCSTVLRSPVTQST
jgi:hypothetical protein